VILLFTDTLEEDWDLYRFLDESAAKLDVPLVKLCDGRNIWRVFRDEKFLGNSRLDPCSRILKRELAQKWLDDNFTPETAIKVVGFDWTELHRLERTQKASAPWIVEAPLAEKPLLSKCDMLKECKADGIEPPRLYLLGAGHNNCSGGCVKAGQAHFAWLLKTLPKVYEKWEANEEAMRQFLGKDVSILTDRRGKERKPMTLKAFRARVETGDFDHDEFGGCECFVAPDPEADEEDMGVWQE
jgi:hypothetical protein